MAAVCAVLIDVSFRRRDAGLTHHDIDGREDGDGACSPSKRSSEDAAAQQSRAPALVANCRLGRLLSR